MNQFDLTTVKHVFFSPFSNMWLNQNKFYLATVCVYTTSGMPFNLIKAGMTHLSMLMDPN